MPAWDFLERKVSKRKGETGKGRKRESEGHQSPHSPAETRKYKHFYFRPIFCEFVLAFIIMNVNKIIEYSIVTKIKISSFFGELLFTLHYGTSLKISRGCFSHAQMVVLPCENS